MRPLTELLRERDCWRGGAGGRSSVGRSSTSSAKPSSRARYAGGREPRGVCGDWGLLERTVLRCGEVKVRIGRGRTGVWTVRSEVELEDEDEDMTEAFLLRSASVGGASGLCTSGDGEETWILSMRVLCGCGRAAMVVVAKKGESAGYGVEKRMGRNVESVDHWEDTHRRLDPEHSRDRPSERRDALRHTAPRHVTPRRQAGMSRHVTARGRLMFTSAWK